MNFPVEKPLVSVVIITFNSEKYVIETLESVKDQTYDSIELIITDDCSSDKTVELCKEWLIKHSRRFIATHLIESNYNSGIAQNCNRGLNLARGGWVKFLAGDDALEAGFISNNVEFAVTNKQVEAICSKFQPYNEFFSPDKKLQINIVENKKFNSPQTSPLEQFEILLRENCVSAPTVMLKRKVLEQHGGFDETFPFLEDWPMWLALTKAGHKMYYLDIVEVKYRVHSHSVQDVNNKRKYKSRVEAEVDKMFLLKYNRYLPFFERYARLALIYRDLILMKLFANQNGKLISFISKSFGIVPSVILKLYKKQSVGS